MPASIDDKLLSRIRVATGATHAEVGESIQALWSGYGEIRRVTLEGADVPSVIVKRVEPPRRAQHRRGWNTDRSHKRKLRSYDVEMAWYRGPAARCGEACRVPRSILLEGGGGEWTFVLEDLDAAGFSERRTDVSPPEICACLDWLADFHARFLAAPTEGLWKVGTYWHLATRPDELAAIAEPALSKAAPRFDAMLNGCTHKTLVHGDAKLANFCFAPDRAAVAAVDFQYVGGGSGIKDVAYFLGSCLDSEQCHRLASDYLDHYFATLRSALSRHATSVHADALEAEWRTLYPVAWADFHRFLAGWAPDHYKMHGYSAAMTERALRM